MQPGTPVLEYRLPKECTPFVSTLFFFKTKLMIGD